SIRQHVGVDLLRLVLERVVQERRDGLVLAAPVELNQGAHCEKVCEDGNIRTLARIVAVKAHRQVERTGQPIADLWFSRHNTSPSDASHRRWWDRQRRLRS